MVKIKIEGDLKRNCENITIERKIEGNWSLSGDDNDNDNQQLYEMSNRNDVVITTKMMYCIR